ncbi:MAG: GyrI-like domain-containing protein [Propionibacteriaceae bacterium]|nr:GyrI-like domain-containing protein [Propionibacteriaceae bacterium]
MSTNLLPIGTFARAAGLSVGALRHYQEEGLLLPARVEAASGYRFYSAAQLVDAEIIRQLRALDVPVPEVCRVVQARDPQVTAEVVRAQEATMRTRLEAAQRAIDALHELVTTPVRLLGERVEVRVEPDLEVLAITEVLPLDTLDTFFERAYGQIVEIATREGLSLVGAAGAIYPGEEWDPARVEVSAFIPVSGAARPQEHLTLPGGRFAVARHVGEYDAIWDTYRAVGAWLATHAETTDHRIREHYVVGVGDTLDPADYVTEIYWPLR